MKSQSIAITSRENILGITRSVNSVKITHENRDAEVFLPNIWHVLHHKTFKDMGAEARWQN